jgi:protein-tyrosine phosphatase
MGERIVEQVIREITLEGTFNFRDLGGMMTEDGRRIKQGMLFRSGNLSLLTAADIEALKGLGIKTICDLRDHDEVTNHPDPAMEGVKWNHIPLMNDEAAVRQAGDIIKFEDKLINSKPGEMLLNMNREMVGKTVAFEKIFRILLQEPGKPLLFHCMAGKDRTGAVAALILSALGVSRELIEADYLYTNNALDVMEKSFEKIGYAFPEHIDRDVVLAMYEARVEYIRAFFDEIEEKYGNVETYLVTGVGLEQEAIRKLKEALLEK